MHASGLLSVLVPFLLAVVTSASPVQQLESRTYPGTDVVASLKCIVSNTWLPVGRSKCIPYASSPVGSAPALRVCPWSWNWVETASPATCVPSSLAVVLVFICPSSMPWAGLGSSNADMTCRGTAIASARSNPLLCNSLVEFWWAPQKLCVAIGASTGATAPAGKSCPTNWSWGGSYCIPSTAAAASAAPTCTTPGQIWFPASYFCATDPVQSSISAVSIASTASVAALSRLSTLSAASASSVYAQAVASSQSVASVASVSMTSVAAVSAQSTASVASVQSVAAQSALSTASVASEASVSAQSTASVASVSAQSTLSVASAASEASVAAQLALSTASVASEASVFAQSTASVASVSAQSTQSVASVLSEASVSAQSTESVASVSAQSTQSVASQASVASVSAQSTLSVASVASVAAARPTARNLVGTIQAVRPDGSIYGYVRPSTNGYGLGVTQDSSPAPPDGTFKFSFRYDPDSSAPFFVSSPMDSRFVGFRAKYTTDLGPGLTSYRVMIWSDETRTNYAAAVNGDEAGIWTYDPSTSALIPTWINSNGQPTTTKVVLYTPRDLVEITGDVDAFNAAYGSVNGNGIPMSFKFIEDNK